ncbi:hypothetical protein [Halorubrum vacuolatum]|uniref:Uncharacterized protein n=1 Tax=Halorubrum vacuolatum TaxID=63740 RepID=A0A238VB81_HALVU|nr:hypothetical protein [Halorubrum vacuolatum]SNR31461.1 hypothetical protein SAMN06264855_102184 [Halorubrum vacuolatum]
MWLKGWFESFLAARRAIVRSDERAILFFLVVISVLGLAMLLYYTLLVLEGLPDPIPNTP